MFVGVVPAEGLAESLADAVAAVRAWWDGVVDPRGATVEADHVVGAGEHDPLHALAAGGLEQVVAADDVRLQHRAPVGLDGLAAEMDDPVHAGADPSHAAKSVRSAVMTSSPSRAGSTGTRSERRTVG